MAQECAQEGLESYVLDTEVVAYDRDTGNLLPFQVPCRSVLRHEHQGTKKGHGVLPAWVLIMLASPWVSTVGADIHLEIIYMNLGGYLTCIDYPTSRTFIVFSVTSMGDMRDTGDAGDTD